MTRKVKKKRSILKIVVFFLFCQSEWKRHDWHCIHRIRKNPGVHSAYHNV